MTTPESWFLERGLPAVLSARARSRHLVARSAPALAAYATVIVALLVVFFLMGTSEIYIDGVPDATERVVLGVIALALPLAVLAGRTVSRVRTRRAQSVLGVVAVAVAAVAGVIQGGVSHLLASGIVIAVVAVATWTGVGAVLGWAVRLTMTQAAAMGALFVRALPVVLLTVVVFFNGYVWILSTTISQVRLWCALIFLFAVTAAFVLSISHARVKVMLEAVSAEQGVDDELTGTPFGDNSEPVVGEPLTVGERINVVVVLAAAQIAHLLMVAACTAAIFFTLGMIVLSPALLAKWTGGAGTSDGTILGMTIPVPQPLMHMTLILCSLTFMYVTARSVGDEEYKRDFLDPLIQDLYTTLIARNRYRTTAFETPTAGS